MALSSTIHTAILMAASGTGSLGLSMAKCCAHVVGVEMVQSAVNDAKANAEANGNVHYCSTATEFT